MGRSLSASHFSLSDFTLKGQIRNYWDSKAFYLIKEPTYVILHFKTLIGYHRWGVQRHRHI